MEWLPAFLVLLVTLVVLLGIGLWIPFALLLTGIVGLLASGSNFELISGGVGNVFWDTGSDFILTQVPMFLLMGQVMIDSGVSTRFYRSIAGLLRSVPGGLLHTNLVSTGIFAAISGSSAATAAAVAPIAVPELTKRGYDRLLIYGSLSAGGTLGILIPPSVPLVIYGVTVQQSISELFTAGIIPGIVMLLAFMTYVAIRVTRDPSLAGPPEPSSDLGEQLRALVHIVPIAGLIAIVLGGLYAGFLTPTEAASVGAVVAVAIAFLLGDFSTAQLWQSALRTVRTTAMILLLIAGAKVFGFALNQTGATHGLVDLLAGIDLPLWVLLAGLIALYLVLGTLMDGIAMMLVTLPIVYPVIAASGIDPIWFGIILVVLIEMGGITPPVGMNLYIIQGVSGASIGTVAKGSFGFLLVMASVLLLLIIFPQLALWLPSTMR